MFDKPPPSLLIAEARRALDAGVAEGFPQKVVANALGIAQRELELGPDLAKAEVERLCGLLGHLGDLKCLNAEVAGRVREGADPFDDRALLGHLVLTTIAKLEIDQPGYPAYRGWKGDR